MTEEHDGDSSAGAKETDTGTATGAPEAKETAPPPPPARPPLSPNPRPIQASPPSPAGKVVHHQRIQSSMSEVSFDISPHEVQEGPWDSKAVAEILEQASKSAQADALEQASKSAGGDSRSSRQKQITLADIKGAAPMEAEAETLLLQALEEREEEKQDAILPHVTSEEVDAFEAAPVNSGISNPDSLRFHEAADQVRSSKTDTKGKLVGLAHAMRLMHHDTAGTLNTCDQPQENNLDSGLMNEPEVQEIPKNDVDTFLNNANILFRRTGEGVATEKKDEDKGSAPLDYSSSSNLDVEHGDSGSTHGKPLGRKSRIKHKVAGTGEGIKHEFHDMQDFIEPRKASFYSYAKWMILLFILPLTIIGIILFYGGSNPELRDTGATVSWLMLFLVRNLITMSMAKCLEVYIIFYLGLRKRLLVRLFGPVFALVIVQSRGYPCILFFYGFISLLMLSGFGEFAKHWLYYQDAIHLCNANNPAGEISESRLYAGILGCCMIFGAAVTLKRHWLGLKLGRRAYNTFGDKLAKVMNKMILISEIAALSWRKPLEIYEDPGEDQLNLNVSFDTRDSPQQPSRAPSMKDSVLHGSAYYKSLNDTQRQWILQQLEAWEEPVLASKKKESEASLSAILQFKSAVSLVDSNYPFSTAFGLADSRASCIDSSQKVYDRLFHRQQGTSDELHFSSIAKIALNKDGNINHEKMKELVRIYRPNRDGTLSRIDFVKSIDGVYKEFRVLQAAIENSGKVGRAFELLVNWCFYVILWIIMFYIVGLDPVALFVSASGFFVGISFMIGASSAKYFDGLLFILVRRPYDIGDRIAISDPENDTSPNGSTTWFVEDLGLYSTTVRLAATNEVATYSNGSLASSRVINANRSPQAVICVFCKFSVNVSYTKIVLFKKAVEKFVKERPREWLSLLGLRATRVEQDLGFIEYVVVLQHRESWQNIGAILNSKAEVTSFSLEVGKQLGMRYNAPPLPVSLKMTSKDAHESFNHDESVADEIKAIFHGAASAGISEIDGDD